VRINAALPQNVPFCGLQDIINEDFLAVGETDFVPYLFSYKKWWGIYLFDFSKLGWCTNLNLGRPGLQENWLWR
jgi:hypothetical protein